MPFESEAQRRFMHMRHPEVAKRWEHEERTDPKYTNKKRRGVGEGYRGGNMPDTSFESAVRRRLGQRGQTMASGRNIPTVRKPNNVGKSNQFSEAINRRMKKRQSVPRT